MDSYLQENFLNDLSKYSNFEINTERTNDTIVHGITFEFDTKLKDGPVMLMQLIDEVMKLPYVKRLIQEATDLPPKPGVKPKVTLKFEMKVHISKNLKRKLSSLIDEENTVHPTQANHENTFVRPTQGYHENTFVRPTQANDEISSTNQTEDSINYDDEERIFEWTPYLPWRANEPVEDDVNKPFKQIGFNMSEATVLPGIDDGHHSYWDLIRRHDNLTTTALLDVLYWELTRGRRYSNYKSVDKDEIESIKRDVKKAYEVFEADEKRRLVEQCLKRASSMCRKAGITEVIERSLLLHRLNENFFEFNYDTYMKACSYAIEKMKEYVKETYVKDIYEFIYYLDTYERDYAGHGHVYQPDPENYPIKLVEEDESDPGNQTEENISPANQTEENISPGNQTNESISPSYDDEPRIFDWPPYLKSRTEEHVQEEVNNPFKQVGYTANISKDLAGIDDGHSSYWNLIRRKDSLTPTGMLELFHWELTRAGRYSDYAYVDMNDLHSLIRDVENAQEVFDHDEKLRLALDIENRTRSMLRDKGISAEVEKSLLIKRINSNYFEFNYKTYVKACNFVMEKMEEGLYGEALVNDIYEFLYYLDTYEKVYHRNEVFQPDPENYPIEVDESFRPSYDDEPRIFDWPPYLRLRAKQRVNEKFSHPFKQVGYAMNMSTERPGIDEGPSSFWDFTRKEDNLTTTGMLDLLHWELNRGSRYNGYYAVDKDEVQSLIRDVEKAYEEFDTDEKRRLTQELYARARSMLRDKGISEKLEKWLLIRRINNNHLAFSYRTYVNACNYIINKMNEGLDGAALVDDVYEYLYYLDTYEIDDEDKGYEIYEPDPENYPIEEEDEPPLETTQASNAGSQSYYEDVNENPENQTEHADVTEGNEDDESFSPSNEDEPRIFDWPPYLKSRTEQRVQDEVNNPFKQVGYTVNISKDLTGIDDGHSTYWDLIRRQDSLRVTGELEILHWELTSGRRYSDYDGVNSDDVKSLIRDVETAHEAFDPDEKLRLWKDVYNRLESMLHAKGISDEVELSLLIERINSNYFEFNYQRYVKACNYALKKMEEGLDVSTLVDDIYEFLYYLDTYEKVYNSNEVFQPDPKNYPIKVQPTRMVNRNSNETRPRSDQDSSSGNFVDGNLDSGKQTIVKDNQSSESRLDQSWIDKDENNKESSSQSIQTRSQTKKNSSPSTPQRTVVQRKDQKLTKPQTKRKSSTQKGSKTKARRH